MARTVICFIGDSITLGGHDEKYLGWPGRLCAADHHKVDAFRAYNLGVGGETSETIAWRWRSECDARIRAGTEAGLIFAFGTNDSAEAEGEGLRVPVEQSLANAGRILSEARAWLPTLMVGPAPVIEELMPFQPNPATSYHFTNERLAEYNEALSETAAINDVPYLDIMDVLAKDERWEASLRTTDGLHPNAAGYGLIAGLVGVWSEWREWID
ncbi:MAG: GDSL-type esterase/lipase family protein [Rhodospirillales bacterium]|jgi:lysophospholipase L1-like esterase|nr:GDSL-type esterase/lipase family protein [Rhodospirillales bacterium]